MDIKGKTALITGSTDGLGKLLAIQLARNGSNVVVTGKNSEKLDQMVGILRETYPSGQFSSILCDLSKPESVIESFSNVSKVDILVNNAGIWTEGATIDVSPERIIEMVNVNLTSYPLISRILLPKLLESEFGQILNVVSVAGYELPAGYYHTIYTATKFGLQGFTEGMTKEFENRNLRVMGFYPGGMETDIFKKAGNDYKDHEPWMFDPMESVEAILFMLTRNKKINVKRMDLINHIEE
jgi:short-subunit dehydrogenase